MKKDKGKKLIQQTDVKRRSFLKKFGMGVVLASTYSVISLTQFGCVHDPREESEPKGGY